MYRRTKKSRKINSVLLVVICFHYYGFTWIVTFQNYHLTQLGFVKFFCSLSRFIVIIWCVQFIKLVVLMKFLAVIPIVIGNGEIDANLYNQIVQ